jgi:hypothetical protein
MMLQGLYKPVGNKLGAFTVSSSDPLTLVVVGVALQGQVYIRLILLGPVAVNVGLRVLHKCNPTHSRGLHLCSDICTSRG